MSLALAAVATAAVEVAMFMSCRRYRTWRFALLCVVANLLSNLALNLALGLAAPAGLLSWQVLLGEALVWAAEFVAYGLCLGFSRHLLAMTCAANAVTYLLSFISPM